MFVFINIDYLNFWIFTLLAWVCTILQIKHVLYHPVINCTLICDSFSLSLSAHITVLIHLYGHVGQDFSVNMAG